MQNSRVYILGGYQTDFAVNYGRESDSLKQCLHDSVFGALQATNINANDIECAHIGNFAAELFCGQGQIGGIFASLDPAFNGLPTSRHEAACASGSMAILAAMSDIESNRYNLIAVSGVEIMRNVNGQQAAQHLGAAAWQGREALDAKFPWPYQFSQMTEMYQQRYGLSSEHLFEIAKTNYANARNNPNAQTRDWQLDSKLFSDDEQFNPKIEGDLRKSDCGRITDGGATVILASTEKAQQYATQQGISLDSIPYIQGWGHRTAAMLLADKLAESVNNHYPFPQLRHCIEDAYRRANIQSPDQLDAIETHDCFTITEYIALEHFGITEPGCGGQAVESGRIKMNGALPVNPSGGLIGCGHPVGATGVRMLLDAFKQVTNTAGSYQVEGAKTVATLNVGGSLTTIASFIVGL